MAMSAMMAGAPAVMAELAKGDKFVQLVLVRCTEKLDDGSDLCLLALDAQGKVWRHVGGWALGEWHRVTESRNPTMPPVSSAARRLWVIEKLVRDIDKTRDVDEIVAIANGNEEPPTDEQLKNRGLLP